MFGATSTSNNKRSSQGGNDEAEKAAKRLCLIGIPQHFEWTGLELKREEQDDVIMEGLVLWNILGFALADIREYASFSAVNKEWNQIVKTLYPPVMFQIQAKLAACDVTTPLVVEDLSLLKAALTMMESKTSQLYRKDCKKAYEEEWPHLQPQFNFLLVRFVHSNCTQRSPNNYSQKVYQMICALFESLAEITVLKMIQPLLQETASSLNLKQLLDHYLAWEGIVQAWAGIGGFLDRYYIKHSNNKPLLEQAQSCLVTEVLKQQPEFSAGLQRLLQQVDANLATMPNSLLLSAVRAGRRFESFAPSVKQQWCNAMRVDGIQTIIQTTCARIVEASQSQREAMEDAQEENVCEITFMFPNRTKLGVSAHFVKSSSLLKHLHLREGDIISWDCDGDLPIFQKALDFFAMDAVTPMPDITTPLHSNRMVDLVGAEYAQFAEAFDQQEVFRLLNFASFLHFQKLLDLGATQVNFMIQGRSPAELRQLFNLPGDQL